MHGSEDRNQREQRDQRADRGGDPRAGLDERDEAREGGAEPDGERERAGGAEGRPQPGTGQAGVPPGDGQADGVQHADGMPRAGEGQADAGDAGGRDLEEARDRYLRLAAEYDNFRKRAARERQEIGVRAQGEIVRLFLDALDDIGRFAHLEPEKTDSATVIQGVEMVEKKLLKALNAAGLQVVNPVDEPFDPSVHEAVATEPALSAEDENMVARVFQPGFVYNGQLLRPARVVVKQWNG